MKPVISNMLVNGKLPALTSVGAYTIVYLDEKSNPLCADCATENIEYVVEAQTHDEGESIQCIECDCMMESSYGPIGKDLKKGDAIKVRKYDSKAGKGLSYPSFTGKLLDDADNSEGWDVVDTIDEHGVERSIYCFSIER